MLIDLEKTRLEIHDANNKLFIATLQLEEAIKYNDKKKIEEVSFRKDLIETQLEALNLVLMYSKGEVK